MKYTNLIIALLIVCLSLPGCAIGSDNKRNSNQELTNLKTKKINRKDLPVKVNDSTWQIIEEVQRINYLEIEYDFSRKNGKVSKNVRAQYWLLPSEYRHGIFIYTKNLNQNVLVHETLHAKIIVLGLPFFYRRKFPMTKIIDNLENEIQHYVVYNEMNKLGFEITADDITNWRDGIRILKSQLEKIPSHAPDYVVNVIGAAATLGGLNRGISINEISERLPSILESGLPLGIKIYNKFKETNMLSIDENFQLHMWIASLLNLSSKDLSIGIIDFQDRNRRYYDPIDGRLLIIKK